MHKKLVIDIGNTLQKLAVFEGKQLILKETLEKLSPGILSGFISAHGPFHGIIQSSVVIHQPEMEEVLARAGKFIPLSFQTPVPFTNRYKSPVTLGKDRIAAVACA